MIGRLTTLGPPEIGDTFLHSWEVLADIISDEVCKGMLIDLGVSLQLLIDCFGVGMS